MNIEEKNKVGVIDLDDPILESKKEKIKEAETEIKDENENEKSQIDEQIQETASTKTTLSEEPIQIKEAKHSKSYLMIFGIFTTIFIILILAIFGIFTFYNYQNSSKIAKGVYINGIDISELTKEDALDKVQNYYSEKLSNDLTLVCNDFSTYIKTSEINLNFDIESAVDYAYQIGKTTNLFNDNFQIFNAMITGINIMPTYTIDDKALSNILNTLSSELPDAVVESGYYIDSSNLIITKGSSGSIIDIDATSNSIKEKISNLNYLNETINISTKSSSPQPVDIDTIYHEVYSEAKDAYYTTEPHVVYPSSTGIDFAVTIDEAKKLLQEADTECTIPLKVLYPNVTTNMIGQEAFPDLLATFSTKYATSNKNRTTNLRLAASKIDGYVLLPDETFSYNSVVGERTIAAGYKEAAIYENGQVVDGLGGGICQISTTLYNATLFANLEMVELYNHQFVPSYVTAGRDATVVYGVKDFKFKNSRKYAIKITCSVSGGVATFNIWGLKEDTEYDIDVYANITSKTSSYIKSSTYRTLKQNGEIINTEKITNSTYKVH